MIESIDISNSLKKCIAESKEEVSNASPPSKRPKKVKQSITL